MTEETDELINRLNVAYEATHNIIGMSKISKLLLEAAEMIKSLDREAESLMHSPIYE